MGQGNAFVAEADDPSAIYFNPAGITQLKGEELSAGLTGLVPFVDRTGAGVPDDQMERQLSVVPNFYATSTLPIADNKLAVGIGLNSPYGITTNWAPTSSVRYTSTESQFEMVDINPTVAYQVSPMVSLGAGLDYVNLINTTAQSQTNQAAANQDNSPDGTSKLSGHGSGWGYDVGILFKPFEQHSFGVSYRSQVRIPIKGSIDLSNLSPSTQADFNFSGSNYTAAATTDVILPANAIVGYTYKPAKRWTLLLDYEWTQWNTFQSENIAINETDPSRLAFLTGDPASNVSSTQRQWHNVSAVGGGANFKLNDAWQLRGGYAYYEKTVPNDTFSPDVPDATVHLLTAGFSRSWNSLILDCAFQGYFYVNRDVDNTVGNAEGGSVNGTYKTFIPSIGLNLTYKFGI